MAGLNYKITVGNYKMKVEQLMSDNTTVSKLLWEIELDEKSKITGNGTEEIVIEQPDGEKYSLFWKRVQICEDVSGDAIFQAAYAGFYGATPNYAGLLLLCQNMARLKTVPGTVDLTAYPSTTFAASNPNWHPPFGYRGIKLSGANSIDSITPPRMKEEHTIFVVSSDLAQTSVVAEEDGSSTTDILLPATTDILIPPKDFVILHYDSVAERWRAQKNSN